MSRRYVKSLAGSGQFIVNGRYIGTDWEYPAAAAMLGYGLRRRGERCAHHGTDGTVDCPDCGKTAHRFISEAADILWSLAD
jgi:hypothetical protein